MKMRKKDRSKVIILLIICVSVYLIIMNTVVTGGVIGGNWNTITTSITSYLPYLIGIVFGFIFIIKDVGKSKTASGRLFLLTGLVGILFSGLFYELNNDGIWIDEIITASFTITDLQVVTILFFILVGALVGLIRR